MEQVLGDDHLCYILLNFAGELDEPRARCVSKHWAQLRRRWVSSLPSNACIHANPVFSPDGAIIAVAGSNYTGNSSPFVMYDVRSGAKRHEIIRPEQVFVGVGFLGDGGIVAVAGNTSFFSLYDTRTGALLQEVALPDRWTRELAVSPDGAMLAVGGDDTVCIYDAATFDDTNTFEVRRTLQSDDWVGRAIAFSPDSSKIAIGHTKIALYETETGDPVRVP